MKPKTIGIVGGAGPVAGASLFQRIVELCQKNYGCYNDEDFPKIILLSYPFSQMLSAEVDAEKINREIKECFHMLQSNGASTFAIACNTLHAFLKEEDLLPGLVHMPHRIINELEGKNLPLVLCTSTSMKSRLHQKFFPCTYLENDFQIQLDNLIVDTLKGENLQKVQRELNDLINRQKEEEIILGCTELSLFSHQLITDKKMIDALDLVAKQLVINSFH